MINYSLALSRHHILPCTAYDTQFCLAIYIQSNANNRGNGDTREKDAKLIANARTAPAHVANLARGFWSPEHRHEESKASLVHRQTFDRTHSRVDVPRKGYDREKAGGPKGSMDGKERATKVGRKKEQKERGKWRNQRHRIPDSRLPRRAPCHPVSLTPCALSSSRYSTRPLKALFASGSRAVSSAPFTFLSPLSLPHSFFRNLVSRTSSLFTSRLDFMRTTKWGYLFRSCSAKCARSGAIIVKPFKTNSVV